MVTPNLTAKAAEWNVALDETRETATSLLGFGVREGRPLVLKLTKTHSDESHSGAVLRAFGGDGAVRVFESEMGAVLMDRLLPGEELVNVVRRGNDPEATRILAHVMQQLANHTPPRECPAVSDWGLGFDRYLASGNQQISRALVLAAQDLYQRLAASQRTTMLLHGDLQHYNVLFDRVRGWTAIDPKGIVGELEYEIGALLRNPIEQPELFTNRGIIEQRLAILCDALNLDHSRALRWSFAQAVLSAIWDVEDEKPVDANHPALLLARVLETLLDR